SWANFARVKRVNGSPENTPCSSWCVRAPARSGSSALPAKCAPEPQADARQSAFAAVLAIALLCVLLDVFHDGARDVHARRLLDALQPWGRIDLHHQRPTVGTQHV